MNVFSTLRTVLQFLFETSPDNIKHQKFLHPFISFCSSIGATILIGKFISDYYEKKFPALKQSIPEWAKKYMAPGLIAYLIAMFTTRYHQNGPSALYEVIWACNLAIVIVIHGILRNKSILISSSIVMISIDQMLWYLDILSYITTGKFITGVAKYITWPETTKLRLMTSTHHLWFIPLLIMTIKKQTNFPIQNFSVSSFMTVLLTLMARLLVPRTIDISKGNQIYMNVNLSHEVWKDVPLDFLRIVDNSHPLITMGFSNIMWNTGNFIFYNFLKLLIEAIQKNNKIKLN